MEPCRASRIPLSVASFPTGSGILGQSEWKHLQPVSSLFMIWLQVCSLVAFLLLNSVFALCCMTWSHCSRHGLLQRAWSSCLVMQSCCGSGVGAGFLCIPPSVNICWLLTSVHTAWSGVSLLCTQLALCCGSQLVWGVVLGAYVLSC